MSNPIKVVGCEQHLIQFMSPGTFCSEVSKKPIDSWSPMLAVSMAKNIAERHGAKPYGFRFLTKMIYPDAVDGAGRVIKLESSSLKSSGTYYLNGKIIKYDDIPETDENRILRSNMWCNENFIVCETRNSYRHTAIFEEQDHNVNEQGAIINAGDDPPLREYRRECRKRREAELK